LLVALVRAAALTSLLPYITTIHERQDGAQIMLDVGLRDGGR